ncbi:hypothetical protein CIHG_00561 [Coccidioides immitis H538.4]|uniref:Uncharacterized protein n=1 Tax=Coccidioides immitis H538.4 TaxID=396776 RepID=A0A0J8U6X4_COCIT|nr:hypothetical protein CIHG_00561 [Coccidioides immitis H538.4]
MQGEFAYHPRFPPTHSSKKPYGRNKVRAETERGFCHHCGDKKSLIHRPISRAQKRWVSSSDDESLEGFIRRPPECLEDLRFCSPILPAKETGGKAWKFFYFVNPRADGRFGDMYLVQG